jgi:hypothetical protein
MVLGNVCAAVLQAVLDGLDAGRVTVQCRVYCSAHTSVRPVCGTTTP